MSRSQSREQEYVALSVRADVIERLLRSGQLHADMLHCADAHSKQQISRWLLSAAAIGSRS